MLGLLRRGFWPSTHPFIAYASLAVAYVASYALILDLHHLRHSWRTTLAFFIFIAFPTNWLLQEFPVTAFSLSFGLVLAPLAAIETLRIHQGPSAGRTPRLPLSPLVIVLLLVLIGFFQSFLLLYLSIGIACILLNGQPFQQDSLSRIKALPWFFGYGLIAILLHRWLSKVLLEIQGLQPAHLDQYTRNTLGMLRFKPWDYLTGHGIQIARSYLQPSYSYGADLWALPLLIIGSLLTYVLVKKRTEALFPFAQGGLLLLLLVSPFLFNVLSTPNRLPLRIYVSFPYVVWVFAMLLLLHARSLRPAVVMASAAVTGLLAFQCLNVTSEYFFARDYNSRADLVTASALASTMLNRPEFNGRGPLKLVVHGELKRPLLSRTAWYSTANGSFFNWDGGNTARIVAYLKTLGLANIDVSDPATRLLFEDQFKTMRPWPDPQSLRLQGDVLLLKLSGTAEPLKDT
jgi:hypothetical protein